MFPLPDSASCLHWKESEVDSAQGYYEAALEKQPDFAQAYAGIAQVWAGRQQMGYLPPSEAGPKAREAIDRALALDSAAFEVQYVAAAVRTWTEWDWEGGDAFFRGAIEVNPAYAEVRSHYAHLLMILGRADEAEEQSRLAMELDPLNPIVQSFHGQVLFAAGRNDEAIAVFENTLRTSPDNPVAIIGLMGSYHSKGMSREALGYAGQVLAIAGLPELSENLQTILATEGAPAAWRFAGEAVEGLPYVLPVVALVLFDYAGDTDAAVSWAETALEVHDPNAPYFCLRASQRRSQKRPTLQGSVEADGPPGLVKVSLRFDAALRR